MSFERLICETPPGSKVTQLHCKVKYIDRNHVKIDAWANITKPIEDVWIHVVSYMFNTYQKLGIDLWENICDWLSGKKNSYIMYWGIERILKYTNLNHSCPFVGHVYIKANNVSMSKFDFTTIIPSGRYRLDFQVAEGDRRKVIGGSKLYFSVSDHRIEVV